MNNELFNEIVSDNINNLNGFLRKYPNNSATKDVKFGIRQLKTLL